MSTKPYEENPNNKATPETRSNFHSLGHSSRKDRNLSSEVDRNPDENKARKEISRLRERVELLESENMALLKTKI